MNDCNNPAPDYCTYLCGLSEDELRVFHQTLQWHSHINDLCPLVFSAIVRHKLAVPGVEDDETCFNEAELRMASIYCIIVLCLSTKW